MTPIINHLTDQVAKLTPGVYSIEYESGKQGTEFTSDALKVYTRLVAAACIEIIEREAEQYSEPAWAVEIVNDICDTFEVRP